MDNGILSALAYRKLTLVSPEGWDIEAFKLYEEDALKIEATKEDILLGWKDGLAKIKETMPKEWEKYQRTLGKKTDYPKVPWDKVTFKKGAEDGNSYRLEFDIDGRHIIIECTDVEIFSPDFIIRKMILYSRKMVECPYLSRSGKQNWMAGAVLPWLSHIDMAHAERESRSDIIKDAIFDYAAKPIWKESFEGAFNQSREPVREDQTIFMPFSGLRTYVRKIMGADTGDRHLSTVLLRLGARKVKKGKSNNMFYALNYDQIENFTPERAGIREDNTDTEGSKGDAGEQRTSLVDRVWEEERARHEAEDGLVTGCTEGTTTHLNDTCGGVPLSGSETGDEPSEIPF